MVYQPQIQFFICFLFYGHEGAVDGLEHVSESEIVRG